MARIRTIKPDFWTDESLTECSLSARLFFIGLLNFADDNGNLTRSSKKLKMQIFPADSIDCEPLIEELLKHGRIIEYQSNGEKYLHIKGFKKHQIINRPSKSQIPEPDFAQKSVTATDVLTEHSLSTHGRKGMEGKGKEKEKEIKKESAFEVSVMFEEFWQAYPKKSRKGFALKAYQNAMARISHADLMAAVKKYQFPEEEKYTMRPEDWLDGDCWNDVQPDKPQETYVDPEVSRWRARYAGFVKNGFWQDLWGPKPGEAGCMMPVEISHSLIVGGTPETASRSCLNT